MFTGSHYDTWRRIMKLSLYFKDLSLQITNAAQKRLATLPGSTYPFLNSGGGSFTPHNNQINVSAMTLSMRRDIRFFVLSREARRQESYTVCRRHYKGSNFFSVIWRPSAPVFPPAQQTGALPTELTRPLKVKVQINTASVQWVTSHCYLKCQEIINFLICALPR